jgi:hypothetical protein
MNAVTVTSSEYPCCTLDLSAIVKELLPSCIVDNGVVEASVKRRIGSGNYQFSIDGTIYTADNYTFTICTRLAHRFSD